jgi:predicted nuclease of predicted toxin-antitoxin system
VTVRFVADENFNRRIVTGLLPRIEDLDLVRVQDVGLAGGDDPTVLGWAAEHGRVLLTHDAATIPDWHSLASPPARLWLACSSCRR